MEISPLFKRQPHSFSGGAAVLKAEFAKQDGNIVTKIFTTQRGYGEWKDYWEFPGGKIEPGEKPEEALCREIREELDTEIAVGEKITTIKYDYPEFRLTMDCFLAYVTEGSLVLKEHEAAKWLKKDELGSVNWLPADHTIIELLKQQVFEGNNQDE